MSINQMMWPCLHALAKIPVSQNADQERFFSSLAAAFQLDVHKAEHGSRLTCGLPDLDPPNYLQVQVLWVQVTHTVGQLRVQV